jgi:hypothetical protein
LGKNDLGTAWDAVMAQPRAPTAHRAPSFGVSLLGHEVHLIEIDGIAALAALAALTP